MRTTGQKIRGPIAIFAIGVTAVLQLAAAAALAVAADAPDAAEPRLTSELDTAAALDTIATAPNDTTTWPAVKSGDEPSALSDWNGSQRVATRPSPLEDDALRAELLSAAQPPAAELLPWVPPNLQAHVAMRAGFSLAALGDADAAVSHLERAIALGRDGANVWRALARARLHTGDTAGARAALMAAIESTPEQSRPHAQSLGDLGELALLERRTRRATLALERANRLAPRDRHIEQLLERARHELDPDLHAAPQTRPELRLAATPTRLHKRSEARVATLLGALPPPMRDTFVSTGRWLAEPQTERFAWVALAVLTGLALVRRLLRGGGDLCVAMEYPAELRGTFTVRIATRAPRKRTRARRARQKTHADVLKGGASSRSVHTLVSRETHFRGLRPRRYWISVEGILQAPDTDEILAEVLEEREAQVPSRRAARVELDLRPSECPVDITVLWDKRSAKDAGVVALDVAGSLRYARGGPVRLPLPRGRHRVAVGSGDRVAVTHVDVDSFQPKAMQIDLAGSENVVFKGCPPAVDLYLHGDIPGAARALEREGQEQQANLLMADLFRGAGNTASAAEHFEAAEAWIEAAELRAELEQWERAAPLFERAGDALRAAEMHRKADAWVEAGAAYEQARDFDAAVECYREANAVTQWIDALERSGRIFEASEVALERTERRRAIRLLQQVLPDDPRYEDATTQLARVLEEEGHLDLAAERIEDYVRTAGADAKPDLQSQLAELLERSGEIERSMYVLEELRRRDPTYPNLATRIESLRKQRSAGVDSRAGSVAATPTGTAALQATAPMMHESRYEIREEIGRGGMGVVYRAHDKRLHREVALKRMPRNLREHPKAVQYFLREAQAVARLNHRNVVTVYDVDQEDNIFFITMELLKGHPLNAVLKRKGRIGARDVAKLGIQVAAGLAYAHDQGVVHRDIKTANLFLTTDKTVTIMDFGLAKMVEEVRKGSTIVGGTPFYMAPEQAAGKHVDARADLYALGVTLFELVTGRVPFEDGDITYHHHNTPAPDPRSIVSDVPNELARLILELMSKTPDERPASAHEVKERLERLVRASR